MMNRFAIGPLALGVILTFLVLFTACGDKERPEPRTIGIVNLTPSLEPTIQGFKEGLAQFGYVEGVDVEYVYEGPVGSLQGLDSAIERVLATDPDLIVSMLTPPTIKIMHATAENRIPVVFGPVGDPMDAGVVRSIREPGGNLTGVRVFGWEPKALKFFLDMVDGLERLYVPFKPDEPAMVSGLEQLAQAAARRGVELEIAEVHTPLDVQAALENIPDDCQGVWALGSGFWAPYLDLFAQAAITQNKPLKGVTTEWCHRGALFSYSENPVQLGWQMARLAVTILEGADPATIPVEQADFKLTVNLATANAIGIVVDDTILKQAETIIRPGDEP